MKNLYKFKVGIFAALIGTSLVLSSCDKDKGNDPTPGGNEQPTPDDPNPDNPTPEVKTFTVKYDADGGEGTLPADATIKEGETVKVTDVTPAKDGFYFGGWKGSDGKTYVSGDAVVPAGNLTLTAIWSAIPVFTVQYKADGGDGEMPESQSIRENGKITVPESASQKEDYLFDGWKDADGNIYQPGTEITITADMVLTINWKVDTSHKQHFSANSDRVKGQAPATMRIYESITLPDAGEMTRLGFELIGWSADKDAKTTDLKAGAEYKATDADTLFAVWSPVSFKITYKPSNDPRRDLVMEYDGTKIESGYVFDYGYASADNLPLLHWVDADGNIYVPSTPINVDKDIELKAVYADPSQFQNWNVININN